MDFHFLVMEKSWKINVEKEGAPCCWCRIFYRTLNQQCPSRNTDKNLAITVIYAAFLWAQNLVVTRSEIRDFEIAVRRHLICLQAPPPVVIMFMLCCKSDSELQLQMSHISAPFLLLVMFVTAAVISTLLLTICGTEHRHIILNCILITWTYTLSVKLTCCWNC